ncbi:CTP pyrophosphohydrolase [Serratia rubidaea]|uniref:CTP pyrophosphohydrolase n=1 Tax=Serratia rubidaea TaxID=61652 RepID=A0A4U9HH50_SERRU|nr:CTP pyrophosphohydrolase [Serratia rubidaea]
MKTIDVVAAIIARDGKILLAQRDAQSDQAGRWEFPGGKVESGESQPQALARELAEELGIEAAIGSYVASNSWQTGERLIRLHAWRVIRSAVSCNSAATRRWYGSNRSRLAPTRWRRRISRCWPTTCAT